MSIRRHEGGSIFEADLRTHLIALCVFANCGVVWSDAQDRHLECKSDSDASGELVLSLKEKAFSLKSTERGCDSEYTYRGASNATEASIIFSAPNSDDMGLNAQAMIFSVLPGSSEAKYIGSIPAGASELEDGSYKDVQQSGESIYESIYRIEGDKISILSPSKELIISGAQCIYQEKNSTTCKDMRGSFKRPLCVLSYGERKVIANTAECAGMNEGL